MNIDELKERFFALFPLTLLENLPDDEWGLHVPAGLPAISRMGFATSLSPWVIEEAKRCEVDFLVTFHDAWDFLYDMRTQCQDMLNAWRIGHLFVHLPMGTTEFDCGVSLLESVGCRPVDRFCETSGIYCGRVGEFATETSLTFPARAAIP